MMAYKLRVEKWGKLPFFILYDNMMKFNNLAVQILFIINH